MEGGPKKHAAVMGRQSSNPYTVRMGSNASRPWDISSPRTNPNSVTTPTIVMYMRVSGRMDLYLVNISDEVDDFVGSSLIDPRTFCFPVAVVDFLSLVLLL